MDSISLRFCFPSYRVCFPISRCYIKYSTFLPIDNYSCRCPKSLFELLLKAKFHHLVLCSTHVLFIFSTTCHPTPPPHSVGYTRPTYHFGDTDFLQFMKTQNVIILCAPFLSVSLCFFLFWKNMSTTTISILFPKSTTICSSPFL